MFKAKCIEEGHYYGTIENIYGVQAFGGIDEEPYFLIYDYEVCRWRWISSELFMPVYEDKKRKLRRYD